VVLIMAAKGITREGAAPKLRQCMEVLLRHNPVNWGNIETGNAQSATRQQVLAGIRDGTLVHAVYTDPGAVASVLKELKGLDTGLSVVVSGLMDDVGECARQAGLEPHTVHLSLGVHGNTASLPDEPAVMAVNTMCGHGMVSFNLIKRLADDVARGTLTAAEAATTMARNCHCGIFNLHRATELLRELAGSKRRAKQAATEQV